jgi:hypothetical protein
MSPSAIRMSTRCLHTLTPELYSLGVDPYEHSVSRRRTSLACCSIWCSNSHRLVSLHPTLVQIQKSVM